MSVFFQNRAIELQTAVKARLNSELLIRSIRNMCVCVCCSIILRSVHGQRSPLSTTTYRACLVFVHTDYKQNLIRGHPKAEKKLEKEKWKVGGVPLKAGGKWLGYEA